MTLILFLLAFVIGPAAFFVLDRRGGRHWPLALLAAVLVAAAVILSNVDAVGSEVAQELLSVLLIWVAWVLVMVLAARALRRILARTQGERWVRVLGALGTTLPWFGFAVSQWMAR
ncbi:MAG: hypothetical protein AAGK77_04630 [Pseudomonadota bacterium]